MKPFLIKLDGINDDKKFKIMQAVLMGNGVSRGDLSQRFDVSSVTVGKVVAAMIEHRLLSVRKQSFGRGRSTSVLRPAPKLKHLVIELGKAGISANLCLFDKSMVFSYSTAINESLDYEDNLLKFYSELNTLMLPRLSHAIYTVSLIVDGETPEADMSRVYNSFPKFKPDAVFDRESCATDYFCKYHASESVILVNINALVSVNLIHKGTAIESNGSRALRRPESTDELLRYLSELLSSLCALTIPDRIAICSEAMPINKDFSDALLAKLICKNRLEKDRIPKVEYRQELPYALVSAIDKISEHTVRVFSGYNE